MVARGGRKPQGGAAQKQTQWFEKPLRSSKGQFSFTLVTDGVYIEHQWGQNSGHIGIPKESIPQFIKYLQAFSPEAAAKPAAKAAGVAEKGKGISKENAKEKKAKKEPEKKPTVDDLDADLMSYQSARAGGDAAEPAAEAADAAAADAEAANV